VAVQRALRNTQATLEVVFYSAGVATDADGAVTVTITRADGTAFATDAATTHGTTGQYKYTLAPQTNLEYFTLVWNGTFGGVAQKITTHTEIVGAFYAPLNDIRAMAGLSSVTNFPNAALEEARQWFEDLAEQYCGRAFVPRYGRTVTNGTGTQEILLQDRMPRRLLSVKVDGTAVSPFSSWGLYPEGVVVRSTGMGVGTSGTFTYGYRNVELTYEHGEDEPDLELREAALRAIQYRLLGNQLGLPAEAISASVDVRGPLTFGATAGPGRPTGIPEVDNVLTSRGMALRVG
jgi:hypothetical protein